MPKRTRKRNPQDATLRNIRALKATVARLTRRVAYLEVQTTDAALSARLGTLMRQGRKAFRGLFARIEK